MKKKGALPFALIIAAIFVTMLVLNLLTPMLADDYRYAYRFDTQTRLQSVWDIFPSLAAHASLLNGRYVPHFFVQLFLLMPRPVFAIVNTFWFLALLLGMYRLVKHEETRYNCKLLLMVGGATILLPPVFGQSFLWLCGATNYLWCDALMVWALVPFADAVFRNKELAGGWKIAMLGVICLLMGNMSENVSAAAALMMGLCAAWQWFVRRRVSGFMPVALVCTVAGWLLLMLAPANRLHVSSSLSGASTAFAHYHTALEMWLDHGLWLSVGFVAVFFIGKSQPGADSARLAFSMGLFICALLCNFAMVASDYYPGRAFTGSVILLILAVGVALYAIPRSAWHQALTGALAFGLTLVMGLEMAYALPSAYNRYRLAQARVAEVVAMRDAGQNDITTFGIKGNTRFDAFYDLNEMTDDPTYFPNVYFAKYYDLNSIVVDRYE